MNLELQSHSGRQAGILPSGHPALPLHTLKRPQPREAKACSQSPRNGESRSHEDQTKGTGVRTGSVPGTCAKHCTLYPHSSQRPRRQALTSPASGNAETQSQGEQIAHCPMGAPLAALLCVRVPGSLRREIYTLQRRQVHALGGSFSWVPFSLNWHLH